MPNSEKVLTDFLKIIKPTMDGFNNAKSCSEITSYLMKLEGLELKGAMYKDSSFISQKRKYGGYLFDLLKLRKIKRKSVPSPYTWDKFVYWVD